MLGNSIVHFKLVIPLDVTSNIEKNSDVGEIQMLTATSMGLLAVDGAAVGGRFRFRLISFRTKQL